MATLNLLSHDGAASSPAASSAPGAAFSGVGAGGGGGGGVFNVPSALQRWRHTVDVRYRKFLDDATPYVTARWASTSVLAVVYIIRVIFLGGWHIISYALGIYILNLLIGFLSPQTDPEFETGGGGLPTQGDDEFRPFVRRLPEFKFWLATTRAFVVALVCTFVGFLNIPVFWPILLFYFLVLFGLSMKKQIRHMIRYRYVPFTTGKRRYRGKTDR